MAMQIVIPVDNAAVKEQRSYLMTLLTYANDVAPHSTYVKVNKTKEALYEAKGMYRVLNSLELIREQSIIGEDIDRIEAKIQGIYEEKRRKEYPKWRP